MIEQRAFLAGHAPRSTETSRISGQETPAEAGSGQPDHLSFRVSDQGIAARTKKDESGVSAETKAIILRLHQRGMPLREIAAIVKLGGEKYPIFKQVCRELGISPNERQV